MKRNIIIDLVHSIIFAVGCLVCSILLSIEIAHNNSIWYNILLLVLCIVNVILWLANTIYQIACYVNDDDKDEEK